MFWTQTRMLWAAIAAAAVVLASLAFALWQSARSSAERKLGAAITLVRDELDTIFNAATSGIVAFGADGRIVRVNNRARHFLGGVSDPVPFSWPEAINFLDSETLSPLEDSADPIKRAQAGHTLRNETHLLRRTQAAEDKRYVRVASARPEQPDSAIHTVLVIDDVSNEERNRQVVER